MQVMILQQVCKNTLVGSLAGDALTDADFNVAVGYAALSADYSW